MSKVTSKLQVTLPKALAEQFHIRPGDEIEWRAAGNAIRIEPVGRREPLSRKDRVKLFDEATARQRRRQAGRRPEKEPRNRGWKREDLYDRARPR
jgi:AbrB family looped-hinge helix DNA binding protein